MPGPGSFGQLIDRIRVVEDRRRADVELAAELTACGETSGEKLWRLPINAEYDKLMDSDIADMKNTGPRLAGGITALVGPNGAGKTTQSALLAEWLTGRGRDVVLTREPGEGPVGAKIRAILLDPATGDLSPRAEALLYSADRAHHVDTTIKPALGRGAVVVCDRYIDSTLAYQGAGRVLDLAEVAEIARWATAGLVPDLTVLLDLDPQVGVAEPDGVADPDGFIRFVGRDDEAIATGGYRIGPRSWSACPRAGQLPTS